PGHQAGERGRVESTGALRRDDQAEVHGAAQTEGGGTNKGPGAVRAGGRDIAADHAIVAGQLDPGRRARAGERYGDGVGARAGPELDRQPAGGGADHIRKGGARVEAATQHDPRLGGRVRVTDGRDPGDEGTVTAESLIAVVELVGTAADAAAAALNDP